MREHRVRARIPAEFEVGKLKGKGKVRNLSPGGLFVGTRSIPPQGETVRLCLSAPGLGAAEITGMVWWTTAEGGPHRAPGFGVQLLEESEDYARMVARLT